VGEQPFGEVTETAVQYRLARTPQRLSNSRDVFFRICANLEFSVSPTGQAWGHASQPTEVPSEVTLVGEPDGQCDLGQRQLSVTEHLFDVFEAALQQISVRRHSNGLTESTCEMMRGKPCHSSETVEAYLLAEV